MDQEIYQQKANVGQRPAQISHNRPAPDDEDEDYDTVPGQYNPDDYKSLQVTSEIEELFTYIGRYY